MLAPALHQLTESLHCLTGPAGLPLLDRVLPLLLVAVVVVVAALIAVRHRPTSRS